MSLDIWYECPTCKGSGDDTLNYTHNVGNMWDALGIYDALYNSHKQLVSNVLPDLQQGYVDFKKRFDEMEAMNPPNGWGDAKGAYKFLGRVIEDFSGAPPGATIYVSK